MTLQLQLYKKFSPPVTKGPKILSEQSIRLPFSGKNNHPKNIKS